jgi:hypothetical protein
MKYRYEIDLAFSSLCVIYRLEKNIGRDEIINVVIEKLVNNC